MRERSCELAGTFHYMAPEVLRNEPQGPECDLWSVGCTLYQLLTGGSLLNCYLGPGATGISEQDPHSATDLKRKSLLAEIEKRCPLRPQERPSYLSPECWDLLSRLLEPDLGRRFSIKEALQHQWVLSHHLGLVPSPATRAGRPTVPPLPLLPTLPCGMESSGASHGQVLVEQEEEELNGLELEKGPRLGEHPVMAMVLEPEGPHGAQAKDSPSS